MLRTQSSGPTSSSSAPSARRKAIINTHNNTHHNNQTHPHYHHHHRDHPENHQCSSSDLSLVITTAPGSLARASSSGGKRQKRISATFGGPGSVSSSGSSSSQSTTPSMTNSPLSPLFETFTHSPIAFSSSFPLPPIPASSPSSLPIVVIEEVSIHPFESAPLPTVNERQHPLSGEPMSSTLLISGTFGLESALPPLPETAQQQKQQHLYGDNASTLSSSCEQSQDGRGEDGEAGEVQDQEKWSPVSAEDRARFTFGYDDTTTLEDVLDILPPPSPIKERHPTNRRPSPPSSSIRPPRIQSTSPRITASSPGSSSSSLSRHPSSKRQSYATPQTHGPLDKMEEGSAGGVGGGSQFNIPTRTSSRWIDQNAAGQSLMPSSRTRAKQRLSYLANMLISSVTPATAANNTASMTTSSSTPPSPTYNNSSLEKPLPRIPLSDMADLSPMTPTIDSEDNTDTPPRLGSTSRIPVKNISSATNSNRNNSSSSSSNSYNEFLGSAPIKSRKTVPGIPSPSSAQPLPLPLTPLQTLQAPSHTYIHTITPQQQHQPLRQISTSFSPTDAAPSGTSSASPGGAFHGAFYDASQDSLMIAMLPFTSSSSENNSSPDSPRRHFYNPEEDRRSEDGRHSHQEQAMSQEKIQGTQSDPASLRRPPPPPLITSSLSKLSQEGREEGGKKSKKKGDKKERKPNSSFTRSLLCFCFKK
ncbi:hypothetical protein EDD21DRAFT_362402 [Dissophora ornata]|nr:hypothetical protein EDD21DRAFT_362402 [Dissophora ornata]